MKLAERCVVNLLAFVFFGLCSLSLHAENNCRGMADMAFQVASIRDAGVARENVEKRLTRDVVDGKELAFALMVVALVYNAEGTPEALKREVLKQCTK